MTPETPTDRKVLHHAYRSAKKERAALVRQEQDLRNQINAITPSAETRPEQDRLRNELQAVRNQRKQLEIVEREREQALADYDANRR